MVLKYSEHIYQFHAPKPYFDKLRKVIDSLTWTSLVSMDTLDSEVVIAYRIGDILTSR